MLHDIHQIIKVYACLIKNYAHQKMQEILLTERIIFDAFLFAVNLMQI